MNEVLNVSAVTATSVAGLSELTFAALEAELIRFTPVVAGSNKASVDYRSLESAIANSNLAAAQVALARLRRDTQATSPSAAHAAPPPAPARPPEVSPGDQAESSEPPHIDVTV
jgi:hypothetical protein